MTGAGAPEAPGPACGGRASSVLFQQVHAHGHWPLNPVTMAAAAGCAGLFVLINAVAWQREADGWVRRARRAGVPAAVLLLDIDHFKRVNDRYGHLAGDELLAATASTLISHVRAGDVLGRFGGEEFVALLPGAGQEQACWMAERLRERVRVIAVPSLGAAASVTVSIGVAELGRDGNELFELLAAADAALYRAKQSGRDRVATLPPGACPSDPRHRSP